MAMAVLLMVPGEARAHRAPLDRPVSWSDWNDDPVVWLGLVLLGWLYWRGWHVMEARAGPDRLIRRWRAWMFTGGWLTLAVALLTPLDPLSDQLAWAHMVQHMILMTVSAPLMMAGAPLLVCLWGLSVPSRRMYGRVRRQVVSWGIHPLMWNPLVVWTLYALTMWLWHVPAWYQAALRSSPIHDLQHLTFFVASCLFWRLLLGPFSRFRLGSEIGILYLFTTTLHATVLGVFMTLAPNPWYADYVERTGQWGLTALEDQQLAGLIMWMPACLTYLLVAVGILVRALEAHDKPSSTTGIHDKAPGDPIVQDPMPPDRMPPDRMPPDRMPPDRMVPDRMVANLLSTTVPR
jgi:putative membrane protein